MARGNHIRLHEGLRYMFSIAGLNYASASRALGRTSSYLSVMFHDRTTPRTDILLRMADVCGYEVVLFGHDEGLVLSLDPDDPTSVVFENRYRASITAGKVTLTPKKTYRERYIATS